MSEGPAELARGRLGRAKRITAIHYAGAVVACTATTVMASFLADHFDLANIVMLFLLTVLLVAVLLGRGPAVLAAFLSVALFGFFFVPPRLSFAVHDAQYLLTFGVMLAVALVTGELTAGLRRQADAASLKEARTRALYEMARELAGARSLEQAATIVRRFTADVIGAETEIFMAGDDGKLHIVADSTDRRPRAFDPPILELAWGGGDYIRLDSNGYFPLKASERARGVMAVAFEGHDLLQLEEQHELLEAVASLTAIVIERVHYVDAVGHSELETKTGRLRSSIVSALSHDIRTPLTAIVGLADWLTLAKPPLPSQHHEAAGAIRDQAARLSGLVANLLEMAKLDAGAVELRRQWQPLEEVVGSSIRLLSSTLHTHPVKVRLQADLPFLEFDAVLMQRVFCNLLENAAERSPGGASIEISARNVQDHVEVAVRDHGPEIPERQQKDIFEIFVGGTGETSSGAGLGLAICRAIVQSHGGSIRVQNESQGGASFVFTLPMGNPPVMAPDEAVPNNAS